MSGHVCHDQPGIPRSCEPCRTCPDCSYFHKLEKIPGKKKPVRTHCQFYGKDLSNPGMTRSCPCPKFEAIS